MHEWTQISPFFLEQIQQIVDWELEHQIQRKGNSRTSFKIQKTWVSDAQIAYLVDMTPDQIGDLRRQNNILPAFFQVDTCAGEFKSKRHIIILVIGSEPCRANVHGDQVIALLRSGPNRIGQGIEFDYSCVRSVRQFQKQGFKVAMINSNPETVSTDYDTSDALVFEPLTEEHVTEILNYINPRGLWHNWEDRLYTDCTGTCQSGA